MKKSEKLLLTITLSTGILALLYVYAIEPIAKHLFVSNTLDIRNKKYFEILNRKDEIRKEEKQVLSVSYWKTSPQEQQTAFQIHIENLAKESGITQIKSIVPFAIKDNEEISLQIEIECSIGALSKLLYKIGASDVPLQVRKLQIYGETGDPNTVRAQIEISSIWLNYKASS